MDSILSQESCSKGAEVRNTPTENCVAGKELNLSYHNTWIYSI